MKLKRKLYSDSSKPITEPVKKERFAKIKQGINYVKTHTFKETATAAGKGIGNYIKKNPDEALVLAGSYTVPAIVASKLKKAGKTKMAALALSTAALPLGEGYIAAKKGIQAVIRKKKKDRDDNKT